MQVILVGCEYAGTTTLSRAISEWLVKLYGPEPWGPPHYGWHDHYEFPNVTHHELTDEEQKQVLALSPRLKEVYQRYNLAYHTPQAPSESSMMLAVGFHVADAVYGPLYFGYGAEGKYADRRKLSFQIERKIMDHAHDTTIVLVSASPDAIRTRMKEAPHRNGILKDKDVELVLSRFEEEYSKSILRHRFTLDTSDATPVESFKEFARKFEPHFSDDDRLRMLHNNRWQESQGLLT